MNSKRSLFRFLGIVALCGLPCAALAVSTNPDTPTNLKPNTIVGNIKAPDGQWFDNYYTFMAGPGAARVRVTLRAGTDAGEIDVGLSDQDGTPLAPGNCTGTGICNGNNVIASGQGDAITTGTFTLDSKKTVVMHVHGRASYYHNGPKPTYRISIDGDVGLDKTAQPLKVVNQ